MKNSRMIDDEDTLSDDLCCPNWTRVMLNNIKCFFRRSIRILQYLPIIWRNEDWDYVWIYELLAYKLERVEKCLNEDICSENSKRYARQARTCKNILKRLIEDDYCHYEWKKHEEKWGEIKQSYGKRDAAGIEVLFSRDKCQTEEQKSTEHMEHMLLINKEEETRLKDLDVFCRIFKKYNRHWWT